MRIGVVDDNPIICGMLYELLEMHGYEVTTYQNPWDVLLAQFGISDVLPIWDVLLVDLLLPELSGTQVIGYLRTHFPNLPIIVISALPASALGSLRQSYPTLPLLTKPFSLMYLLRIIEAEGGTVASR
jgi:DNA-binding response OmpR family regulator